MTMDPGRTTPGRNDASGVEQCKAVLPFSGRCQSSVWREGARFCVLHDLWDQIVEIPRKYTEGPVGMALAAAGFDLSFIFWYLDIVNDEGIAHMLRDRYKLQDRPGLILWIRQVVASTSPAKNQKQL